MRWLTHLSQGCFRRNEVQPVCTMTANGLIQQDQILRSSHSKLVVVPEAQSWRRMA